MEEKLSQALLSWYDIHKRDIPWRKDKEPYHIWVSEIMCQQTRIETVIPFYFNFISHIPTIQDLANYPMDDLLKLWQGLGYYNRVKNMQLAAQEIVQKYNGIFPKDFNSVIRLKGIGKYTAGAILSISYDLPFAAVDGNVLRVFTRLYEDDANIAEDETKKKYKEFIEKIIPSRAGDFNQAIMDLGATICPPNDAPKCDLCPLHQLCKAHLAHKEENYPVNQKKLVKKEEKYTILMIYQDDKVLIHKRDDKGLLSGLYEFKNLNGFVKEKEIRNLFKDHLISIDKGEDKSFQFTHKTWLMKSYILHVHDYKLNDNELFVSLQELNEKYSIPTAFIQFIK